MTGVKQIARATPYASSDDFRKVFDEHMNSLYLLAFLLTADEGKAEQCFCLRVGGRSGRQPSFQGVGALMGTAGGNPERREGYQPATSRRKWRCSIGF